jgi:hypothetical protein
MNIGYEGVSLLVEPEEAMVVEPEFPSRLPPLLFFLLSLPLLQRLLFLLRLLLTSLLLLGGQGSTEGCCGINIDDMLLE